MRLPSTTPSAVHVITCSDCKEEFETHYIQSIRCEVCREKTVDRPKPLTKGLVGTPGRSALTTMKEMNMEDDSAGVWIVRKI